MKKRGPAVSALTKVIKGKLHPPNFDHPSVQRSVTKALAWVKYSASPTKSRQASKATLDRIFQVSGNPTSKWLRTMLLTKTDTHIVGKRCCSYVRNEEGYQLVAQAIAAAKTDRPASLDGGTKFLFHISAKEFLSEDELRQLTTKEFEYREGAAGRLLNDFQNINGKLKGEFWSTFGINFHYDIQACAPTLLFQKSGMAPLALGAVWDYLHHRTAWRQHVSDLTGCDKDDAKKILNAMFNGARMAPHDQQSVFKMLGFNREALIRLRLDPKIMHLRKNIKRMWDRLSEKLDRPFSTPKQKWGLYFQLERQVLNVMRLELHAQGLKHFAEHDGFSTDCEADLSAIESRVLQESGFVIKLEEKVHEWIDLETGEILRSGKDAEAQSIKEDHPVALWNKEQLTALESAFFEKTGKRRSAVGRSLDKPPPQLPST